MFAAFAVVAVLLATAGLYGVMAFTVSQWTPESAIRLALGASTLWIAGEVVGRSCGLAVLGIALGLAGAIGLAQTMHAALYGVTPSDPATYAGAAVLALTGAVLEAWIPKRRAVGVDPNREPAASVGGSCLGARAPARAASESSTTRSTCAPR